MLFKLLITSSSSIHNLYGLSHTTTITNILGGPTPIDLSLSLSPKLFSDSFLSYTAATFNLSFSKLKPWLPVDQILDGHGFFYKDIKKLQKFCDNKSFNLLMSKT